MSFIHVLAAVLLLKLAAPSQCSLENALLNPLTAIKSHNIAKQVLEITANHGHHGSAVVKRQVDSNLQGLAYCYNVSVGYQCTSGYIRKKTEILLMCRNDGLARLGAQGCATNSNGEYCAAVSVSYISEFTNGVIACSSSTLSCTSSCRSSLVSIKSTFGCCLNSVLNTTDNPTYGSVSFFSYSLWQRCSVAAPPRCTNGLTLPQTPSNAQTCTTEQLSRKLAEYDCEGSSPAAQPLVDALHKESRCSSLAQTFADGCGVNANGKYCSEVTNLDSLSSSQNVFVTLETSCHDSTSTSCSTSCQQAIQNVNTEYGCCFGIYNKTVNAIGGQNLFRSLSYGVWSACGVNPPGACQSTLSASAASRVNVFVEWLFAAITAFLVVAL